MRSSRHCLKLVVVFSIALAMFLGAIPQSAMAKGSRRNQTKTWTYLVYLAGDNNLDAWGSYSLDLMWQGMTSDDEVNVVLLFDHLGSNAEYIEVHPDGWQVIADGGEPDMGDPETLREFLEWGMDTYPAEYYVLVLWDHGGGWKYFAHDDTDHSRMSIDGLAQAIADAEDDARDWIDVILFDACIMAMLEVAYELRDVTDYMVASTHTVDGDGFPYHTMLQGLVAHPDVSPWDHAKDIADAYYEFVQGTNAHAGLTVSAIQQARVRSIAEAVDALSLSLIAGMDSYHGAVGSARANAEHQTWAGGAMGVFWYLDLWVFADQIADQIGDAEIVAQAEAIQESIEGIDGAVYALEDKVLEKFIHGLTINFPPSLARYEDPTYLAQNYQEVGLGLTEDTHWDEMLLSYYRANQGPANPQ